MKKENIAYIFKGLKNNEMAWLTIASIQVTPCLKGACYIQTSCYFMGLAQPRLDTGISSIQATNAFI